VILHLRLVLLLHVRVLDPQNDHYDDRDDDERRHHADHHAQHRRQPVVLPRPLCNVPIIDESIMSKRSMSGPPARPVISATLMDLNDRAVRRK